VKGVRESCDVNFDAVSEGVCFSVASEGRSLLISTRVGEDRAIYILSVFSLCPFSFAISSYSFLEYLRFFFFPLLHSQDHLLSPDRTPLRGFTDNLKPTYTHPYTAEMQPCS
jgi:hypothetical protein